MQEFEQTQKNDPGNRQYLLRRFWATSSGYWRRGGERSAWVLTSGLFVLILLNLGITYEVNVWNRTCSTRLSSAIPPKFSWKESFISRLWQLASVSVFSVFM